MFGKVTQIYIVVTVCLIIQLPETNAVNLYRCRMPDGSIELNSTGCTNGKLEKSYQYKGRQNSQQKNMPTKSPATFEESIQRSADQSARQMGFRDFDELLSVKQRCLDLSVSQAQIGGFSCSLQDFDCFQREANHQMEETNRLMNSTEWYSNRCDKIPWSAFTGNKQRSESRRNGCDKETGDVVMEDVCGIGNSIIESSSGWYVAAEHYSGVFLYEGDSVCGNLTTYGMEDICRGDSCGSFYIEDYESSLKEAKKELCE